jgi:hypothetical protein
MSTNLDFDSNGLPTCVSAPLPVRAKNKLARNMKND